MKERERGEGERRRARIKVSSVLENDNRAKVLAFGRV
jgi:hypothetical protein